MEPNIIYSTFEVKKLCRVCLSTSQNKSSIWDTVFVNNIGIIQLVGMIMECTSVIIEKDDGFPEYICFDCSQQLASAYCFKQRCEKSDSNLKQIFEILRASGKSCDYILIENSGKLPYIKVKNETLAKNQENGLEITKNITENKEALIEEKQIVPIKVEEYYLDTSDADVTLESKVDIIPELDKGISGNADKNESELENCTSVDDSSSTTTCSNCLKKFKNKKSLGLHKYYCKRTTFSCNQCPKNFPNQSLLSTHLSTSHGEVPTPLLTCDICSDNFEDKSSLIEHFYIHIETSLYFNYDFDDKCETYLCYPCNKNFSSAQKLIKHCNQHSQNNNYQCRKCNEIFEEYALFRKHIKRHGIPQFFCGKCLLSFDNLKKIQIHKKVQHVDPAIKDTFECPLCENAFKTFFMLKIHLKEHEADLYKCLVCFKCCNSITELKSHKRDHNLCNLCPECGKQFTRPAVLDNHIRSHHQKLTQVTCDVCNKIYNSPESLKIHKRTHTKEKPYGCSRCSYRTGHQGDLKTHMRVHTGEKPYVCRFPNCGQRFKTSSHRIDHHRQHTGERNYECKICKMKFVKAGVLGTHMAIHSSKKYQCDICAKTLRRKYHLTIHRLKIHGIPKDKCNKI